MQLLCFIVLVVISVCKLTNGRSNDIVSSLRCKLLCKEANGYSPKLEEDGICKCNLLKTLTDKQLVNIQDLSTYYNLPVLFKHDRHSNKIKRQVDNNLIEDIRTKWDEHQQHWVEQAENLKSMWEQQRSKNMEPLLGSIAPVEDRAGKLKKWQEEQVEHIGSVLEEKKGEWQDNLEKLKDETDGHLENLKSIHEDLINGGLEEHLENLKSMHEDLLGDIPTKLEDNKQQLENNWRSWQEHLEQGDPILGQMAPSLTTYDSKATGIGGSNVNFPPPNNPNPFIPPLAHVLRAFPFPRFNIDVAGGTPLAAAAPAQAAPRVPFAPPFAPHIHPLFHSRNAAQTLPGKLTGPYNPANPIVVQPVIFPPRVIDITPKPILHSLKESVDDMLANMKKHGGRLMPENYLNSDALSNSESQVNQINVNVRVEPTPTPPNLFSFFLPYNRNFLAAPAPKNIVNDDRPVTEDPGMTESAEDDMRSAGEQNNAQNSEEEDFEEEHRMRQQLNDANKSNSELHVADSVKKNLRTDKVDNEYEEALDAGKYNAHGIIVQPKQFMQDSDEDLETLAK